MTVNQPRGSRGRAGTADNQARTIRTAAMIGLPLALGGIMLAVGLPNRAR